MNTEDGIKTKAAIPLDTGRSYFEWENGMLVIRRGKGEIAMAGGELARFFGVTWRKVSGRLRAITEDSILSPDERNAGERKIVTDKEVRGYAPLYPLPTIIALSFPEYGENTLGTKVRIFSNDKAELEELTNDADYEASL